MSFIRFLQNSDVRALNLVFLVPWWLAWSFDKMFRLLGVSGLLEADHLWPITLPKGPLGLNQWWKPLYCCGTTIKNVFTFLNMPPCTFIIQQYISFFFFTLAVIVFQSLLTKQTACQLAFQCMWALIKQRFMQNEASDLLIHMKKRPFWTWMAVCGISNQSQSKHLQLQETHWWHIE